MKVSGPWPWTRPAFADDMAAITEQGRHWSPQVIVAYKSVSAHRIRQKPNPMDRLSYVPGVWATARHQRTYAKHPDHHPDVAPVLDCTCGFYSWKTEEQARDYTILRGCNCDYHSNYHSGDSGYQVWRVELSGTVIEHERGYRSEKLRLVEEIHP